MILSAAFLAAHLYTVQPGDTLSGIAAAHGVSLSQLEAANPQIGNPDVIYAGQHVSIGGGGTVHHHHASGGAVWGVTKGYPNNCGDGDGDGWDVPCGTRASQHASSLTPVYHHHHHSYSSSGGGRGTGGSGYGSSDLADIPGVPRSFAACVARTESSNGTNQAYNGGVYGIIRASGINVNGASLSAQKAAFSRLYAQYGSAPWSPSDHCL